MLPVEWPGKAQIDLADVQDSIEQRNPRAASKRAGFAGGGLEKLPLMPYLFQRGRTPGTRDYVVPLNCIFVYHVGPGTITILLRVLHARRQFP